MELALRQWLPQASASSSPSRASPARSMASACRGFIAERGETRASTAPCARRSNRRRRRPASAPDGWIPRTPSGRPQQPMTQKTLYPLSSPSLGISLEHEMMGAMRAVVQRVSSASVVVDGVTVGGDRRARAAGPGRRDPHRQPGGGRQARRQTLGPAHPVGEKSCSDIGAPLLVVSQFTLYGDPRKGRRPPGRPRRRGRWPSRSWRPSAPGYASWAPRWKPGVFGADMKVTLINDGPITLVLDIKRATKKQGASKI